MRRAVLAAVAAIALAAPPAQFRFSRSIQAAPGWARLELPDDVLNVCRTGLPDLRIQDEAGKEVPYAFEQTVAPNARRFRIENLESIPKNETTGWIDRGPNPGFADAVTFEIAGKDFLKPVLLQSSEDQSAWKDVAKGSLFATGDIRMLMLRFPENNRRFLRFRLDDRNGEPVQVAAVTVRARAGSAGNPLQERPLAVTALHSETDATSLYSAVLPAANLSVTALRFQTQDLALSRPVRVYERVFFRDEVFRRILAEGTITRTPGSLEAIDLPACGVAARNLEIEIDNGDSPALSQLRVAALVRGRTLRFLAPEGGNPKLLYGSPRVRAPLYDLGRAFAGGIKTSAPEAKLGAARAEGTAVLPVTAPPRAPLPDPEKWTNKRPITLPPHAAVSYLDLVDMPPGVSGVRVVDEGNRQVAFIVEQGSHEHRRKVRPKMSTRGTRTVARMDDIPNLTSVDGIELAASGPDYFSREVTVREEARDGRGVTGTSTLGAARWVRQPGEPSPVLRIPLGRPGQNGGALLVEIENGDNVSIGLGDVWITTAAVRVDFVSQPGERLFLLSGNPEARPPNYDLAMLANVILATPAEPARLGAPVESRTRARTPAWFPIAAAFAALLLLFQLSRTLKAGP